MLLASMNVSKKNKQDIDHEGKALSNMERRHQAELEALVKRQKEEYEMRYNAKSLAESDYQLSRRKVMARVVEVSAAEISSITKQMEEKLPLEIREMIYALCWDDDSLAWAQDLLRFSQILGVHPDIYFPYEPLHKLDVKPELHDQDFVKQGHLSGTQHLCQLDEDDIRRLNHFRYMDKMYLSREEKLRLPHASSEPKRPPFHVIAQFITAAKIVGRNTAKEVVRTFYKTNPCTFYVEVSRLKFFLEFNPFQLGLPPKDVLTKVMVPFNPRPEYYTLSVDLNSKLKPLFDLKHKTCFFLKLLIFEQSEIYKPQYQYLQMINAVTEELRKTLKKVSCLYLCGCSHPTEKKHVAPHGTVLPWHFCTNCGSGVRHDAILKPFNIDSLFRHPVDRWGARLREMTWCEHCTEKLDTELALEGIRR